MSTISISRVAVFSRRTMMWVTIGALVPGMFGRAAANASTEQPEAIQAESIPNTSASPRFSFPGPSNVWHYLPNGT